MASKSSFLPRLTLSRGDAPILPFYNPSSPPVRKKPSEYDLSDLSPRPEDRLLASETNNHSSFYDRRSPPIAPFSDNVSTSGSASKMRPPPLFQGPPPPIATSRMIYRDEENASASRTPRGLEASSFARNLNSVLFDRTSPVRIREQTQDYEPDAVWRNLQHRERTLQKELQQLLDAQSAGLAAHLDPDAAPSSSARSDASDAGSSTPTDASGALHRRRPHIRFEQPTRATPTGEIIPVRQPRKKPIGLRAARNGLARNITLLADLKAEEDANLASALSTRKKALSQLRKLAARKDGITEELRGLESDGEEPLTRELRELGEEHEGVTHEIVELEERLVGLRNRRRWLDGRLEDVRNRREAGLSGYKGALKEVDSRVEAILRRPPVKPLDVEAIVGRHGSGTGESDTSSNIGHGNDLAEQSPGGTEFLRMRPERRTIEMAREWWEGEVGILERRKDEVDRELAALEEGVEVWKGAVKLVTDFENSLRKEMKGEVAPEDDDSRGKGKDTALTTPEQAMFRQLDKMATVISGLDEHLQIAEERGWNLLICAIGAEFEAFKQAEEILRDALHAAGFDVPASRASATNPGPQKENDYEEEEERYDGTQSLARLASSTTSGALRTSFATARSRQSTVAGSASSGVSRNNSIHDGPGNNKTGGSNNTLVDLHEEEHEEGGPTGLARERSILDESDNEVPPDLLVSSRHEPPRQRGGLYQAQQQQGGGELSPTLSRDDSMSENEVPLEFLAEHDHDHDHDGVE